MYRDPFTFGVRARQLVGADVEQTTGLTNLKVQDLTKTVGTASTLVCGRNSQRAWVILVNDGTSNIYLKLDAAAVANQGIRLNASGGAIILDANTPFFGEIFGIAAANSVITVTEGYYE